MLGGRRDDRATDDGTRRVGVGVSTRLARDDSGAFIGPVRCTPFTAAYIWNSSLFNYFNRLQLQFALDQGGRLADLPSEAWAVVWFSRLGLREFGGTIKCFGCRCIVNSVLTMVKIGNDVAIKNGGLLFLKVSFIKLRQLRLARWLVSDDEGR